MTTTEDTGRVPAGPEDETVLIAGPDFARRRFRARLRRWRPLLLAGLALVLVVTGVWLVFFSSVVTVRGVEVSGNADVATARIERVARVPVGEQLARVDLDAIQARVEAIPAIRSASVSRSWPHTIRVEVTERVPIAVVDRGTGLQAVDSEGVLFGRYATAPPELPLVRTKPDVRARALAEAARVVGALPGGIAARVKDVDAASADEISFTIGEGPRVTWGSAESSATKAEVLAALLRQNGPDGKPFSRIDVSVPGRPTTR